MMARDAFNAKTNLISYDKIDNIVFSGMGGSGALADIFVAILSKSDIHTCVVKGYHLPNTVNKNTLVVATSISGNTAETLNVLSLALKKNCRIAAFSSGGKMEEFCYNKNIEYRKISQIHSPRASFSIFLYSMLKALKPVLPIKKQDVMESLDQLESQKDSISSSNLSSSNPALCLAEWIKFIPLIYYPWDLQLIEFCHRIIFF